MRGKAWRIRSVPIAMLPGLPTSNAGSRLPLRITRSSLGSDATDAESVAFFTNRRKEIEAMLKSVHRKGIDQYLAGDVEEAIKTWTVGEALDYWGDIDFRRDIDKAKKLLDLREQK